MKTEKKSNLMNQVSFKIPDVELIEDSEKEEMDKELKRKEKQKAALAYWQKSGIPQRHGKGINKNLFGPWFKAFNQACFGIGQGSIFVLSGPRGTGKTKMSVELIREACKKGFPSFYIKAIDFFLELRGALKGLGNEADVLEKFVKIDYLVIDAMEERGESVWENRLLSHLIDRRYDSEKDTVLITNQTKDSFEKSVGPSISSRIAETGGLIDCVWESFRRKKEK